MTLIAGNACIGITPNPVMLLVSFWLVMIMAVDAAEGFQACRIGMAFAAGSPGALVLA